MDLEDEKVKLERKLSKINNDIEKQKNTCSHININMGSYGIYPDINDKYCCLICGMGKNNEYYHESKYIVHAENYLTKYDIRDHNQYIEKL